MGDLPRWIDDDKVDSSAMFAAYLGWRSTPEGRESHPLAMVVHRPYPDAPPNGIECKPCATVGCRRCALGQGGYKFHWYSPQWQAAYLRLARPGAWKPAQLDF